MHIGFGRAGRLAVPQQAGELRRQWRGAQKGVIGRGLASGPAVDHQRRLGEVGDLAAGRSDGDATDDAALRGKAQAIAGELQRRRQLIDAGPVRLVLEPCAAHRQLQRPATGLPLVEGEVRERAVDQQRRVADTAAHDGTLQPVLQPLAPEARHEGFQRGRVLGGEAGFELHHRTLPRHQLELGVAPPLAAEQRPLEVRQGELPDGGGRRVVAGVGVGLAQPLPPRLATEFVEADRVLERPRQVDADRAVLHQQSPALLIGGQLAIDTLGAELTRPASREVGEAAVQAVAGRHPRALPARFEAGEIALQAGEQLATVGGGVVRECREPGSEIVEPQELAVAAEGHRRVGTFAAPVDPRGGHRPAALLAGQAQRHEIDRAALRRGPVMQPEVDLAQHAGGMAVELRTLCGEGEFARAERAGLPIARGGDFRLVELQGGERRPARDQRRAGNESAGVERPAAAPFLGLGEIAGDAGPETDALGDELCGRELGTQLEALIRQAQVAALERERETGGWRGEILHAQGDIGGAQPREALEPLGDLAEGRRLATGRAALEPKAPLRRALQREAQAVDLDLGRYPLAAQQGRQREAQPRAARGDDGRRAGRIHQPQAVELQQRPEPAPAQGELVDLHGLADRLGGALREFIAIAGCDRDRELEQPGDQRPGDRDQRQPGDAAGPPAAFLALHLAAHRGPRITPAPHRSFPAGNRPRPGDGWDA